MKISAKGLAGGVAMSTISILLTLLVLEVALRVYWHLPGQPYSSADFDKAQNESVWMRSPDPILLYEHRPNFQKEGVDLTEANGILRQGAPIKIQDDAVFRIALIGDSIAAGFDVEYEERFATVLEGLLNGTEASPDRPVEVLNFAINGYGTLQEAVLLETKVSEFDPDVVLLQYCLNDPGVSLTPGLWFRKQPRSYFIKLVKDRLGLGQVYVPQAAVTNDAAAYWYDLYNEESDSWKSVLNGFSRIDQYAKSRDIPVVLALFPFFIDESDDESQGKRFRDQVLALAQTNAWTTLDLSEVYSEHPVETVRVDVKDIYHPNGLGHRLAAEAISERLRSAGHLRDRSTLPGQH